MLPAVHGDAAGSHVAVEGVLQAFQPLAEDLQPERGHRAVLALGDAGHALEGVVVVVQDLLVPRVVKVPLDQAKAGQVK